MPTMLDVQIVGDEYQQQDLVSMPRVPGWIGTLAGHDDDEGEALLPCHDAVLFSVIL